MAKAVQGALHCRCGREKILANGFCVSCYSLKRQDAEYFGGLRETVLERDGYRCRVCDAPGGRKWELIVHHRVPGKSVLALMISLCPGCHARIHRTKAVLSAMPPLLLKLWREQHPRGHEQVQLDFSSKKPAAKAVPLLPGREGIKRVALVGLSAPSLQVHAPIRELHAGEPDTVF